MRPLPYPFSTWNPTLEPPSYASERPSEPFRKNAEPLRGLFCVRQLRPFGARAHRRAFGASKKGAMRARSDGGEIAPLPAKAVRASFPSRQAYHGAGNRLAPTAHFSEGGKTAYCNAIAYAICPLRRDIRKASGRRASLPALRAVSTTPPAGRTKGYSRQAEWFDDSISRQALRQPKSCD